MDKSSLDWWFGVRFRCWSSSGNSFWANPVAFGSHFESCIWLQQSFSEVFAREFIFTNANFPFLFHLFYILRCTEYCLIIYLSYFHPVAPTWEEIFFNEISFCDFLLRRITIHIGSSFAKSITKYFKFAAMAAPPANEKRMQYFANIQMHSY